MGDAERMKIVGRRRSAGAAPFAEWWDGFAALSRALCRGLPVPRGVWLFRTFEEAQEWEDRMLLGERPPAGRPLKKTRSRPVAVRRGRL